MTETITITHLETGKLHPVYVQYDGQFTTQPAFVEHDTTDNEINTLLDEVGSMLSKDVEADVEHLCEFRTTDSHGIYVVGDWMEGIDPCEEYGITADTTDDELQKIATDMVDYATGEGATITGVAEYCENLRDELNIERE